MRCRRAAAAIGVALTVGAAPAALADAYPPPSDGQGTVDPSRIKAGECTDFSGDGFRPLATITVSDDGFGRGTTQADATGSFTDHLCFDTSTKPGKHQLRASGQATDFSLYAVNADLIVQGVSQSHGNGNGSSAKRLPAADAPPSNNAAFSGEPALAGGAVVLLLGGGLAWTLVVSELRHRRKRRQA